MILALRILHIWSNILKIVINDLIYRGKLFNLDRIRRCVIKHLDDTSRTVLIRPLFLWVFDITRDT